MYFFIVVRQGRLFVRLDEWGRRNIVLVGGGTRVDLRRVLRLLLFLVFILLRLHVVKVSPRFSLLAARLP